MINFGENPNQFSFGLFHELKFVLRIHLEAMFLKRCNQTSSF